MATCATARRGIRAHSNESLEVQDQIVVDGQVRGALQHRRELGAQERPETPNDRLETEKNITAPRFFRGGRCFGRSEVPSAPKMTS